MLSLRPTILLSLALALLVNTTTASSGGKDKPSCDKCQTKIHDCELACPSPNKAQCSFQCACKIASEDAYCQDSCGIAGPESGCSAS